MELAGRVALITGGRRIGAVVATELARGGADIALVYRRSRAEAEETADTLRALGRRVFLVQADLASPDSCDRVVDETVDALGRLDVLVNMASIYVSKPLDEVTVEDWNTQMAVDLRRRLVVRAGGGAAHAPAARRTDHQLQRLGRPKRPSSLYGISHVLRGQGWRHRAD